MTDRFKLLCFHLLRISVVVPASKKISLEDTELINSITYKLLRSLTREELLDWQVIKDDYEEGRRINEENGEEEQQ